MNLNSSRQNFAPAENHLVEHIKLSPQWIKWGIVHRTYSKLKKENIGFIQTRAQARAKHCR